LPDKIIAASLVRGKKPQTAGLREAVFPASVAAEGLKVRKRAPGDLFLPSGMNGSKRKLKKFLIDCKIPQAKRDFLPLVVDRDGILWIAGVRGAHREQAPVNEQWLFLELLERGK
jgi:tRNA(Ile)-lysidine synthase